MTLRKAIKEGWLPPKKEKEEDLLQYANSIKIIEGEKKNKKIARKEFEEAPIWKKIKKSLKVEFGKDNWDKWLSKLEVVQIEKKEIEEKKISRELKMKNFRRILDEKRLPITTKWRDICLNFKDDNYFNSIENNAFKGK